MEEMLSDLGKLYREYRSISTNIIKELKMFTILINNIKYRIY